MTDAREFDEFILRNQASRDGQWRCSLVKMRRSGSAPSAAWSEQRGPIMSPRDRAEVWVDRALTTELGLIVRSNCQLDIALRHLLATLAGQPHWANIPRKTSRLLVGIRKRLDSRESMIKFRDSWSRVLDDADAAHEMRNRITHDEWTIDMTGGAVEIGHRQLTRDGRVVYWTTSLESLQALGMQLNALWFRLIGLLTLVHFAEDEFAADMRLEALDLMENPERWPIGVS